MMNSAARSLTDWPGLRNSHLPRMSQPVARRAPEPDQRRVADRVEDDCQSRHGHLRPQPAPPMHDFAARAKPAGQRAAVPFWTWAAIASCRRLLYDRAINHGVAHDRHPRQALR